MPYRQSKTIARQQAQLRYVHRAAHPPAVLQCLIVSAEARRREMFERAASDGGWKTSLCVDAGTALAYIERHFVQLAIVDLESQPADAFRPVVARLTAAGGPLVIVCGHESQMEEEIWARQSGAWLYLPGVVESTNLALLCGEAWHIAQRLAASSGPHRIPSSAPAKESDSP